MRNARVFISCGQRGKTEKKIGMKVEDYFKGRGFETYLAERVHSSEALTENIFKFLKQSEYFVFIDFRREPINKKEYRGSLFVNEEIAIATFLRLQGIGFYEKGVKREGVLNYHIYNAFPFEAEKEIIDVVEKETKEWDMYSINELEMVYNSASALRNVIVKHEGRNCLSDWYFLEIRNCNKTKHAFSCSGYATRVKNLGKNEDYNIRTNELIWSGIEDTTVNIMGGTARELDAFYMIHGENQIHFHERRATTTAPGYSLPVLGKGKYLIEFTVISSNFEKLSQNYTLELGASVKDILGASVKNVVLTRTD